MFNLDSLKGYSVVSKEELIGFRDLTAEELSNLKAKSKVACSKIDRSYFKVSLIYALLIMPVLKFFDFIIEDLFGVFNLVIPLVIILGLWLVRHFMCGHIPNSIRVLYCHTYSFKQSPLLSDPNFKTPSRWYVFICTDYNEVCMQGFPVLESDVLKWQDEGVSELCLICVNSKEYYVVVDDWLE